MVSIIMMAFMFRVHVAMLRRVEISACCLKSPVAARAIVDTTNRVGDIGRVKAIFKPASSKVVVIPITIPNKASAAIHTETAVCKFYPSLSGNA